MTFDKEQEPRHKFGPYYKAEFFPPKQHHIEYIAQEKSLAHAWVKFIPQSSQGFTQAGVECLNDSIRTYIWALLGAQSRTRAGVLGNDGRAFDAQKEFLALVEDAIASPVDIGEAIQRYQDVLRYARSSVNYSFGQGLYMSPSDMELKVGQIAGHNNEIVIAGPTVALGINSGLNQEVVPTEAHAVAPPPEEKKQTPPINAKKTQVGASTVHDSAAATQHDSASIAATGQHNDEKTALIVGGIAIGIVALWLFG